MKFKNILLTFVLAFTALGLYSQDSSPVNQGEFLVGAAVASNTSISDLALSPSAAYAMTDQILVGVNNLQGGDGDWSGNVFGRYYLSSPFFAQAAVGYDSVTEDVPVGLALGVTGFLNNWLYVEPNLGVNIADDTSFELSLNFGLRF